MTDTCYDIEEEPNSTLIETALSQPGAIDDSFDSNDPPTTVSSSGPSSIINGPRMPIPSLVPVAMRPLDPSGNQLVQAGSMEKETPDFSGLPFKNVEELAQFLAHNESDNISDPIILKGGVQMLHHHLVGIPVPQLTFDNILKLFYVDYRYSQGQLQMANCHQVRDLNAVQSNLFVYGGHLVNTLEIYMIQSKHPDLAINRTTLRYKDEKLNLWFCELYTD